MADDVTIKGLEFEIKGNADKSTDSINKLRDSLSGLKSAAGGGFGLGKAASELKSFSKSLDGIGKGNKIKDLGNSLKGAGLGGKFKAAASSVSKYASSVKDALSSVSKVSGRAALSIGKIATLPFKSAAENAKNFAQKLATVGSSFKRILFYRAIRTLIKEIGQAFKDGTSSLYAWSSALGGEFAASMDSIATSFAYFKNSVGAAVAPLINALAPAIEFVIEKAVALLNVINQLFARLSGASYWTKATRQATSYGDAASEAGGAAKEAMKYLAPFDELNVLPDNSSGGGGGGGGGAGGSGLFEEVVEFGDAIEELGELFDEGKFFEAGQLLAEKFGEIVDYLDEKINSEEFRSKLLGALSKVTDIINGFFDGITFSENGKATIAERLGDLVGDAIGLFLESLHTWYSGIDWSQIGVALAQFVNGGIESLKEQPFSLGDVLADWINSKIDLISGFANTVKWSEIGSWIAENINDAISGIDWSKAGATLMQVITGLADIVLAAVYGLDADIIGSAIGDFLSSAVSKAQEWLTETPFREIGKKVGELLTSAVSNINDVLEQSSLGTIGASIARFINGALEGTDWKEIGALPVNIFGALIDNIISFLKELDWGLVTSSVSDLLIGAFDAATNWYQKHDWTAMGSGLWQKLKDAFEGIDFAGLAESFFTLLGTELKSGLQFLWGFLTGVGQDIADWWATDIKGADFSETASNLWSAFTAALGNINTWVEEHVVTPFGQALFGDSWDKIWNTLNGPLISFPDDFWDQVLAGLNSPFEALQKWADEAFKNEKFSDWCVKWLEPDAEGKSGIDKAIGNWFESVKTSIKTKWVEVENAFIGLWNELVDKLKQNAIVVKIADFLNIDLNSLYLDPVELPVTPELKPTATEFSQQTQTSLNKNNVQVSITPKLTATDVSYDTIIQKTPTTIEIPVRPSFGFTSFAEVAQQENKIGIADLPVGYKTNWQYSNSTIGTDLTKRGMVGEVSVAATYRNNWQYPNSTIGTDLTKRGMAGNATVSVGYQSNWQYPNNSIGVSLQKRGWVGSASVPIGYYSNWTYPNSTVAYSLYQRGWIGSASIGVDYTRNWTYSGSTIAKDLVAKGWAGTIYIPVKYSTTSNVPMAAASGGVFSGGKWQPIESFASGGFPGGQMFIAREAGPELVGTLKGHTAVMNNDQIVASVSAGVARAISDIQFHMTGFPMAMPTYSEDEDTEEAMYRAFMRALSTIDLSTDDHLSINMDGDPIYQGVVRRNRQNTRMTGVNQLA